MELKMIHVYMTTQTGSDPDDDDDDDPVREAHEDGEGSGYQKD